MQPGYRMNAKKKKKKFALTLRKRATQHLLDNDPYGGECIELYKNESFETNRCLGPQCG